MIRLIDAGVAHALVKQYDASDEFWSCTGGTAIRLIHNAIDNTPTVDAVPVVRCRDCKYRRVNNENEPYCTAKDGLSDPWDDEFCSHGKRKEQTHGES